MVVVVVGGGGGDRNGRGEMVGERTGAWLLAARDDERQLGRK